jgi:succinoglycan biosynthesis transport protein ExoP
MAPVMTPAFRGRSPVELRHYLTLLRRRKLIVLSLVLLGGVIAGLAHAAQTPQYSTTAQLLLLPNDPSERVTDTPSGPFDAGRYAAAQVTVLLSQEVAQGAAEVVPGVTASEVRAALRVTPVPDSDVLTLTATDPEPARAAAIANAVAETYVEQRRVEDVEALQLAAQQIGAQLLTLQQRLADLRQQASGSMDAAVQADLAAANVQYATLFARQQDLLVDSSLKRGEAQVVDPARTPLVPDGLSPSTAVALGVLLGGLLGLGAAWLREQFDDRLRLREEMESATGLPVLGELPLDSWSSRHPWDIATEVDPHSAVAEALRSLRTNVSFLGIEDPVRRVLVTSAMPGDGKTFVAVNLAAAFAQAGLRTVVVSADLRRPRMEEYFELPSGAPGLTTCLAPDRGRRSTAPADPDRMRARLLSALQPTAVAHLVLLPSGPLPPNPSEVLSSSNMDALLDVLDTEFDMVVVDTSPVLAVADAAVLAAKVGKVLLVASAKSSRRREMERMTTVLDRTPADVLGVVLNRASSPAAPSYTPLALDDEAVSPVDEDDGWDAEPAEAEAPPLADQQPAVAAERTGSRVVGSHQPHRRHPEAVSPEAVSPELGAPDPTATVRQHDALTDPPAAQPWPSPHLIGDWLARERGGRSTGTGWAH